MSAYFTIVETPAGFLLLMLALALMLGQTVIFLLGKDSTGKTKNMNEN